MSNQAELSAMRRQLEAEQGSGWGWPNVVRRQALWAIGGILMAVATFGLLVLWPLALLGVVGFKIAIIITAVVLALQYAFARAGRRVVDRQVRAEEEFKAAAIAEFGDEAAARFGALEPRRPGDGD